MRECDEGYACKRIACPFDDGKSLLAQSKCISDLRKDAIAYIEQLEAQKQPETLVHCGECMRYMPEPMGDVMMCYGFASGHYTAPEDFCSRGVPRK